MHDLGALSHPDPCHPDEPACWFLPTFILEETANRCPCLVHCIHDLADPWGKPRQPSQISQPWAASATHHAMHARWGTSASFSWGSNSDILWIGSTYSRITHHELQWEKPAERWSRGSLDPWDLSVLISGIPNIKVTYCHLELRIEPLFVAFVCLFIHSCYLCAFTEC